MRDRTSAVDQILDDWADALDVKGYAEISMHGVGPQRSGLRHVP